MVRFKIPKTRKKFLTKKDISKELEKTKEKLKGLERFKKLEKKFQISRGSSSSRSIIKRRILRSDTISDEAKKRVKILSIQGEKKKFFFAAVPKGVRVFKKKK